MRWLRLSAGVVLLVVGAVGLFLPVLQGWLMIGLGAILLAPEVPVFRRVLDWVERRYPRLAGPLGRLRRRIGGGEEESRDGGEG